MDLRVKFYVRNSFDIKAFSFFRNLFKMLHNVTIIIDFDYNAVKNGVVKSDGSKPGKEDEEADVRSKLREMNRLLS